MKFSLVNGERREAEKGLAGICIGCGLPTIPKCGPIKVRHWAHKSKSECDHWWENETEWHRAWKNNFPGECQEFRQKADDGEWHIADVKTKQGHFLEFQHSFLNPEERLARNNFYGNNLVWIVDGLKRKNDLSRFNTLLKNSKLIHQSIQLIQLPTSLGECPILKEWSECSVPVFFDFGPELPLCCLLPKSSKGVHYLGPFPRKAFVSLHNGELGKDGQNFAELMRTLNNIISAYENPQSQNILPARSSPKAAVQPIMQRQTAAGLNLGLRHLYSIRSPRRRRRF